MKLFFIFLILIYQKLISAFLKNILGVSSFCRLRPSCSEFSKQSIIKYGVLKGGYLSFRRIINCR